MASARKKEAEGQEPLFAPACPNGVPLNEAVSILIKEMRRGKEIEALYWAKQIEARFHKYVWRRLAIFAAEDVGLANPDLIVRVRALWESYMQVMEDSSSKSKPDGNLLTMAVVMCARTPKNREIDNIKNVVGSLEIQANWAPEIPDYALDNHTARGRAMNPEFATDRGRTLHWFTQGSHVENEVGFRDAQLWHFRNMVRRNLMGAEEVEAMAAEWDANGWLMYGLGGIYAQIPDSFPKD